MRWFFGLLMAGGLVLTQAQTGRAEESRNAAGGSTAAITSTSPYGFYPGWYAGRSPRHAYRYGYAVAPGATYSYSSGYQGAAPASTVAGPVVNPASPNAATYSSAVPQYRTYRPTGYYRTYTRYPGWARRGLFGRRAYHR